MSQSKKLCNKFTQTNMSGSRCPQSMTYSFTSVVIVYIRQGMGRLIIKIHGISTTTPSLHIYRPSHGPSQMTVLPADLCILLPAHPCLCFFYQPTMSSLSRTGIRHLVYSRHPSTVDTQIYSDSEPDRAKGQEGLQIRMSKANFKCLSLKRIYCLSRK